MSPAKVEISRRPKLCNRDNILFLNTSKLSEKDTLGTKTSFWIQKYFLDGVIIEKINKSLSDLTRAA